MSDHLISPKDVIEKTGSKIETFWNLQQSITSANSSSRSVKKENLDNEKDVNK